MMNTTTATTTTTPTTRATVWSLGLKKSIDAEGQGKKKW